MSKLRKNTRATRAELRTKMRNQQIALGLLNRQAEETARQLDGANYRIAQTDRALKKIEAERMTEQALVKRIVALIRSRQRFSGLLPLERVDSVAAGCCLMPPPPEVVHYRDAFCPKFDDLRPLSPISLNELFIALECDHRTWNRIVWARVRTKDNYLGASVKLSDEMLQCYRGDRARWIEEIGRQIAAHLFAELEKPTQ